HHASSGWYSARPASWPRGGIDRSEGDERARGDDGQLSPAESREAGDGVRGSELSQELDRSAAQRSRGVQSADDVSGRKQFVRRANYLSRHEANDPVPG